MSRTLRGWLALGVGVLWFAGPSGWLAGWLDDARARDLASQDIDDPIQAVLMAQPEELPRGAEARAMASALSEAVRMHEGAWLQVALEHLDEDQAAAVLEARAGARLPRSRTHPQTPPELLRFITVLSEQAGSATVERPEPVGSPADLQAEDVVAGLLALAEAGQVRDEQVPVLLACALEGVEAHEAAPALIAQVLEGLPERALERLEHAAPLQQGFGPSSAKAIARLEARSP